MTAREKQIAKLILDCLHEQDGRQLTGLDLHARIGGLNVCGAAEFDEVITKLDTAKFITSVPARFGNGVMKHNITDAGEAARLEMR